MFRYRTTLVAATAAACAGAGVSAMPGVGGVPSTGCYELSWGSWSRSTIPPTYVHPGPTTVQLHVTGSLTPKWILFGPDTLNGSWQAAAPDTLSLEWSDGSNWILLPLHSVDSALAGTARMGSGEVFNGSWPTAEVRARRIKCS